MTQPAFIVLRPGDKVLITLIDDLPDDEVKAAASTLRKSFPGVDFTVMCGVAGICIQS